MIHFDLSHLKERITDRITQFDYDVQVFCSDIRYSIDDFFKRCRMYIRHRYFDRYDFIYTGLDKGYYPIQCRLLHGAFNLLVDYVEHELAWQHAQHDEKIYKSYPWWAKGRFRIRSYRNPHAGFLYIKDTLSDLAYRNTVEYEYHEMQEIWDLYNWWKFVRSSRPSPEDACGFSAWHDKHNAGRENMSDEDKETLHKMNIEGDRIQQEYDAEDLRQLTRLIKIRRYL